MAEETAFYFAYGSNLSKEQMIGRLGRLPPSRIARLPGYRIAFNKRGSHQGEVYANIVANNEHEVWGVVYQCRPEDLEKLDGHEGVSGGHYHRLPVEVIAGGEVLAAETYVAGDRWVCREQTPSPGYAAKILQGATDHGLPEAYLEELKRRIAGPENA